MAELTIEPKGRVTLTMDLLDHLGVRPGEKLVLEHLPSGRIEISKAPKAERAEESEP
ncbi:hypothetical protein [Phenylobacterium sp.]|uniref:hypothetical protein n=1 Tax=Phenylobacterium sp. TaxID=1871053 RepID=UPI0025F18B6A|nr:hypothetical protein [Phenylobacterium sp.]